MLRVPLWSTESDSRNEAGRYSSFREESHHVGIGHGQMVGLREQSTLTTYMGKMFRSQTGDHHGGVRAGPLAATGFQ